MKPSRLILSYDAVSIWIAHCCDFLAGRYTYPESRFPIGSTMPVDNSSRLMGIAIDRYLGERLSLEQASAVAGVSLWRFLDELKQRKVALKYSMADAGAEIERLKAGSKV